MKVYNENIDGTYSPVIIDGVEVESPNWSFSFNDMGENRCTYNITFDFNTTIQFKYSWFILYEGKRYYLVSINPNYTKQNTAKKSQYILIFGGSEEKLKRFIFREIMRYSEVEQLDMNANVNFVGTIVDLARRLEMNFDAHFGVGKFIVDVNPTILSTYFPYEEYKTVSFTNASCWDVVSSIYDLFGFRTDIDNVDGVDYLRIGYGRDTISHIFEYGGVVTDKTTEGGLKTLNISFNDEDIRTRLYGTGGSENLPVNYFSLIDDKFLTDGEYTEDLAYYRALLPKSFRMYVMGHNDIRLKNRFIIDPEDTFAQTFVKWNTYYKNYNNGQFKTIDFDDFYVEYPEFIDDNIDNLYAPPFAFKAYMHGVQDKLADNEINPNHFFPIYWVDSQNIEKYGVIEGVAEENSEIFPSIIGVERDGIGRIDEIIDAEQIGITIANDFEDDPIKTELLNLIVKEVGNNTLSYTIPDDIYVSVNENNLYVIDNKKHMLNFALYASVGNTDGQVVAEVQKLVDGQWVNDFDEGGTYKALTDWSIVEDGKYMSKQVINEYRDESPAVFNHFFSESGATYRIVMSLKCGMVDYYLPTEADINAGVTDEPKIGYLKGELLGKVTKIVDVTTFDIWIKDIGFNLGDSKYWGTENAMIRFNTGLLAGEYDFELTRIGDVIHVYEDTSKSKLCMVDGVEKMVSSAYRITLSMSDADYESTGMLLPNYLRNAKGGDFFLIHNIELPFEYVYYAEQRWEDYLRNGLSELDNRIPSITFELDNIFLEKYIQQTVDADKIKAGNIIKIRNRAVLGSTIEEVVITSITKTPSGTNISL